MMTYLAPKKLVLKCLFLLIALSITHVPVEAKPLEHIQTENQFKSDVLISKVPVFIDFYAEWCGPCKRQSPIFEALSKKYRGKIKFVKINVDKMPGVAARYRVSSIPTLLLISRGKAVAKTKGLHSEKELEHFLTQNLSKTR